MMDNSNQLILEKGVVVKLDGLPYKLLADTPVLGSEVGAASAVSDAAPSTSD